MNELVEKTAGSKIALVHGDISPKNILIGPNGPVFLDAECACYGEPAFDAAFCLTHFLLNAYGNQSGKRVISNVMKDLGRHTLQIQNGWIRLTLNKGLRNYISEC